MAMKEQRASAAVSDSEWRRAVVTRFVLFLVLATCAGCQSMGATPGKSIDDASITASVKSKLVAQKMTNLTRVDVDTNKGTVYLNGIVDSPDQKATAEALARQVTGVKSVVNNLQVLKK
jgi:osmotically-inducible protein OsmY